MPKINNINYRPPQIRFFGNKVKAVRLASIARSFALKAGLYYSGVDSWYSRVNLDDGSEIRVMQAVAQQYISVVGSPDIPTRSLESSPVIWYVYPAFENGRDWYYGPPYVFSGSQAINTFEDPPPYKGGSGYNHKADDDPGWVGSSILGLAFDRQEGIVWSSIAAKFTEEGIYRQYPEMPWAFGTKAFDPPDPQTGTVLVKYPRIAIVQMSDRTISKYGSDSRDTIAAELGVPEPSLPADVRGTKEELQDVRVGEVDWRDGNGSIWSFNGPCSRSIPLKHLEKIPTVPSQGAKIANTFDEGEFSKPVYFGHNTDQDLDITMPFSRYVYKKGEVYCKAPDDGIAEGSLVVGFAKTKLIDPSDSLEKVYDILCTITGDPLDWSLTGNSFKMWSRIADQNSGGTFAEMTISDTTGLGIYCSLTTPILFSTSGRKAICTFVEGEEIQIYTPSAVPVETGYHTLRLTVTDPLSATYSVEVHEVTPELSSISPPGGGVGDLNDYVETGITETYTYKDEWGYDSPIASDFLYGTEEEVFLIENKYVLDFSQTVYDVQPIPDPPPGSDIAPFLAGTHQNVQKDSTTIKYILTKALVPSDILQVTEDFGFTVPQRVAQAPGDLYKTDVVILESATITDDRDITVGIIGKSQDAGAVKEYSTDLNDDFGAFSATYGDLSNNLQKPVACDLRFSEVLVMLLSDALYNYTQSFGYLSGTFSKYFVSKDAKFFDSTFPNMLNRVQPKYNGNPRVISRLEPIVWDRGFLGEISHVCIGFLDKTPLVLAPTFQLLPGSPEEPGNASPELASGIGVQSFITDPQDYLNLSTFAGITDLPK